jgi:predicted MPP superfamily phosphohydrolase
MRVIPFALPVAALAVLTTAVIATPASAASGCASFSTDLHQLVRADTGSSFVSTWSAEVAKAQAGSGFTDTGVVAEVSGKAASGTVAVNRLRKGSDYRYASSAKDLADAKSQGYTQESQPFFAAVSSSGSCSTPVRQLTQQGKHRLAVGASGRTAMMAAGWSDGGVLFYVAPPAGSDPGPVTNPSPPPSPSAPPSTGPWTRPVPTGPTAGAISGSDSDTKFSIAVVPDIQRETHTTTDTRIANRSEWLVANQAKLDIRYAAIVGDISDWDTPDHALYANAAQGLLPLQAKIPMAAVPGNHDTGAVCAGGASCPGAKTWETVRDTKTFNKYFPRSRFSTMSGEFEPGKVDNAYSLFRSGGKDFMVISLELWPRKEVVGWAADLVKNNPHRNVIVLTHAYLEATGTISKSNGGYGATTPQYVYDTVVKPYANVKLMLSGHTGKGATRTDTTAKGTKVVSMLQCFHSATNPVRLIEIDTKAGTMKTWVYAPKTNETFTELSQTFSGLKFVS